MAEASPQDVVAALHLFGMARDRVRAAMAGALGIGLTDIDALEHLERFGPLPQRELGARLCLTSGAVTLLVDRLERNGWVRRVAHPTDRRVTMVELLPEAALPEAPELARYHADLRAAAEALSPAARAEGIEFLRRLVDRAHATADALRARPAERGRTPPAAG